MQAGMQAVLYPGLVLGLVLGVLLGGLFGFSTLRAADPLKVGFVYIGPIGDHGWTFEHHRGLTVVEEQFGERVTTTFVENVPESSDAERVIRELAASGHGLIFTTSFGYMDPTLRVAERFPNVTFEHATGYKTSDNMANYNIRFYEGRYVVGQLVGKMTKTDVVGYIASFPIPEVIQGINAFTLGARQVNPDIQVNVIWVSTWFDPGKEADAARVLIDQGADVLLQHTDSPAALQVAEQRGVFAIGQASDMRAFGPNVQLTSIVNNWGLYYTKRVQAVLDGTWESSSFWGGFADGVLELAPIHEKVPAKVREETLAVRDQIKNKTRHPFTGPIVRQDGSQVIAAGETLDDNALNTMNYFVQGVQGTIPN